jgi:hypothetical protein
LEVDSLGSLDPGRAAAELCQGEVLAAEVVFVVKDAPHKHIAIDLRNVRRARAAGWGEGGVVYLVPMGLAGALGTGKTCLAIATASFLKKVNNEIVQVKFLMF